MATESNRPTLIIRLQLGPRGDVSIQIEERHEPRSVEGLTQYYAWVDPDDAHTRLRKELPVALATWLHRWRRYDEGIAKDQPPAY